MRDRLDLFIASVLVLFLELACIRWFPAHVLFLTFFTNVMLLAAFLGISVGCLAAGRRQDYLAWTPLLLLLALGSGASDRVGAAENRQRRAGRQRALAAAGLLWRRVSTLGPVDGFVDPDRGGLGRALRPRRAGAGRAGPAAWAVARASLEPHRRLHREHRRKPRRHSAVHRMFVVGAGTRLVVRRRAGRDRLFRRAAQPRLSTAALVVASVGDPAARVLRRGAGHRTLGHHAGVSGLRTTAFTTPKSRASSP